MKNAFLSAGSALVAALFLNATAFGAPFTSGNLVVERFGDASQTLANTGNTIYIDEYAKTAGAAVQSIKIPDSGATTLIDSGTASSDGGMTLSPDGKVLCFPGYNATRPVSSGVASATSTAVPRGVGKVDGSGAYALVAAGNYYSANNIRGAATDGVNNFWAAGTASSGSFGINYLGTASAAANVYSANLRCVTVYGGNLWYSTGSSTPGLGLWKFTGTPTTTTGNTAAHIITLTSSDSMYNFSVNSTEDTIYYSDDGAGSSSKKGIHKWTKSGGVWSEAYVLVSTTGFYGLTVDWTTTPPTVYATSSASSANTLVKVQDTGAGAAATTLATAAAGTWFRGVAFAPASTVVATQVRVETKADGTGVVGPAQTVANNTALTVYAISRDGSGTFAGNVSGTWSLTGVTGSIVSGDLVASGDGKSATFTANHAGTAVVHVTSGALTSVDSGTLTVNAAPTSPTGTAVATPPSVLQNSNVLLTVTVTPGANPTSTGLSVTADLTAIGGSASQTLFDDGSHGDATAGDNVFSFSATIPSNATSGSKTVNLTIQDAQGRSTTSAVTITLNVLGNLTIIHANDVHARVTPHKWVIPQHTTSTNTPFETAGGAAYLGGKILQLAANQPDALVLDGGDISEGNPVGDWNGPPSPVDVFGNGTTVAYYQLLDSKLRAISGRGGRGLDAMVVGNHDIRDISYLNNLKNQTSFPVISINICSNGTHNAYFKPYVILNLNGNKIGVIGYTTETSDSPETAVNTTINVVKCDWSSSDSTKIHFADYVNDLRVTNGCNLVVLLTHDGHSDLCTSSGGSTPILVDSPLAKLPEVAITGHWHTYCDTVWQPSVLNYKTIFTEEGSFMHYVGTLQINGLGQYLGNTNYPIRDSDITPDPDIANLIQTTKDAWNFASTNASSSNYTMDQVVGYSSDDLLLDNYMKWWSSDEYPWSGNNTAGNWICDAIQWKAALLFGQCDGSIESGGGVRSDIPAGPITYAQIYETYPWADDLIYEVNMTGQQIWNYVLKHGCDVGVSRAFFVKGHDGVPTSILVNGQPIDLAHTYKIAINNYMYTHDSVPFTDPSPQTSPVLARDALVAYTAQYPQANPYNAGNPRYSLDTEFSGGYYAVVTMMNDKDSSTVFDDGFIRFIGANPETLAHRGAKQVPTSLVNADGSFIQTNRLGEIELYRSYLGFRTNVLHSGDIIETWGKGSFFGGDPEFVDQEGITADGVEFKIVGHTNSVPAAYVPNIATALDDFHKNHYIQFLATRTGSSTVVDQQGTTLPVMDVTAYSSFSLPGANGNLLLLTGVPTSENFGMRFRCASAVLASSAGFTAYPPASSVDPVPVYLQTASVLHLTAQASVQSANKATLTSAADAEVAGASGRVNSNFGTSTSMFLQSAPSTDSFGNERAWVKFNLAGLSLPSGAQVTNVQFKLFCYSPSSVSDMPVEVRTGSSDSWTETGITWNTQPSLGNVLDTQTLSAGVQNLYYSWNVTSYATNQLTGDQLVSLVAKPVTESTATSLSYGTDSKDFSSGVDAPLLEFDYTVPTTPGAGVANVQFQYRYSADGSTWTTWGGFSTVTTAPYAADFNYPNGYGYYEFRSIATGTDGNAEPAPALADTSVQFDAPPTVTLTVPANGATVVQGQPVTLTASASDNGSVTGVNFNVDGVLVASVATSPYTGSWTPTVVGSHALTAVATDNVGLTTTSAVVTVTVAPQNTFTTPHLDNIAGDVTNGVGGTVFINHGLVGVGHISASALDTFGETFGSVSGLKITGFTSNGDGSYSGTVNVLPDRGYNSGNFYSHYAARINQVGFHFTPYYGSTNIGGVTDLQKLNAQTNQFTFGAISGVKFTYFDPITGSNSFTTGLDPGTNYATLFGKTMPYVGTYVGFQSPSSSGNTTYPNINKLPLDCEALVVRSDGSGYIGDEYGANVYYFNPSKQIVDAIVPPPAFQPHSPAGVPNYSSVNPPLNGRRNNQGFEGVDLSPDGTRLFMLLQTACVQDGQQSANNQLAKYTRLLIYDVSTNPVPTTPMGEYVLPLPAYKGNGNGGAADKTCAQSEVVALDDYRFLVLPRDGNGLGNSANNPNVYKTLILVDIRAGSPSDISHDAARNAEGGTIISNGVAGSLDPLITPLSWTEAINLLNTNQLGKFNVRWDSGSGQVSKLTMGEKWEGAAIVSAKDPANPNDYFVFVGNDNDFLTSNGQIVGPDGTVVGYNGFAGYSANRIPAPLDSTYNENDTRILAYRVTVSPTADVTPPLAGTVYYSRAAGVSLKIAISDLLAVSSDANGYPLAFIGAGSDGFNLTSTNDATLRTNSTFIFYTNSVTPNVNDGFQFTVSDGHGGTATGAVVIVMNNNLLGQNNVRLNVSSTSVTANFFGLPGFRYTVERSTNLVAGAGWVPISTNTAPANGLMQVIDTFPDLGIPVPPGPAAAYYRLRYNP